MDVRIKKLAENLVNYSCKVKEGEKVYINYIGQETEDLARAIVKEVYKAKGKPFVHYISNEVLREVLLNCDEEQMKLMAEIDDLEMSKIWLIRSVSFAVAFTIFPFSKVRHTFSKVNP